MGQEVETMLKEALDSYIHRDAKLAEEVRQRDVEVDRLNFVITRQYYSVLNNHLTEEDINLSLLELDFFATVASQVERIADHSVKIAQTISSQKPASKQFAQTQTRVKQTRQLLQSCVDMIKTLDKTLAHQTLDSIAKVDPLPTSNTPQLLIIHDSLDRTNHYLMNLAEITIDHSILRK